MTTKSWPTQVCWLVELCPYPVSDSTWDVPALVPIGCWAEPGSHHHSFQLPNMAAFHVHFPKVSCLSIGDSPRPGGRFGSGSYQITTFVLGLSSCVYSLIRVGLYFLQSLGTPEIRPYRPSKANALGIYLLNTEPWAWGPDVGLRTFTPVEETLK